MITPPAVCPHLRTPPTYFHRPSLPVKSPGRAVDRGTVPPAGDEWPARLNGLGPVLRSGFGKPLMPRWRTGETVPADDRTETLRPADLNANFDQIW